MAQYVYGKNAVRSLLDNGGEIEQLTVLKGRGNDEIAGKARAAGIPVNTADRSQMDRMADGNHQGYIARIREFRTYKLEELIKEVGPDHLPLLVALDGLEDPHNLGAILRTAACVGADGVIIEKNRSVSLTPTVAKVSSGGIDRVKVAVVTNLSQALRSLKKQGYWVVGTDVTDSQDYRNPDYRMAMVLVIGSEAKGMHRLVAENCDIRITLPMAEGMESLNASVAAGILLYEIYSQRFPLEKG